MRIDKKTVANQAAPHVGIGLEYGFVHSTWKSGVIWNFTISYSTLYWYLSNAPRWRLRFAVHLCVHFAEGRTFAKQWPVSIFFRYHRHRQWPLDQ